jgi:hypothetical protein
MKNSAFKNHSSSITTNSSFRITPEQIQLAVTTPKTIHKFASLPLEPGIIQNGEIANPGKIQNLLAQLVKQHPLPDNYITMGIPEHSGFVKPFAINNLPDSEILPQIIWESESQFPLPADELYIDWRRLDNNKAQVAAVPKKVIDQFITVFQKQKLIPLAIETTSLSLIRLAPELKQTTLIIEADNTSTLVIAEPNQVINLTAVSQINQSQLNNHLSQIIIDMLNYYQKTFQQPIQKIIYTGALQNQLIPILPIEIPNEPIKINQVAAHQTVSYALAQMPITPPDNSSTINLIPPILQADYDHAARHHLQRTLLIISASFLFLLNLISSILLIQILNQPTAIQTKSSSSVDLAKNINQINQQSQGIIQINQQQTEFIQIFNQILSLVPSDLNIIHLKLDHSTKTATIRGFASTQEQVLEFKKQIEIIPEFINISLPLSILQKQTDLNFTITFTWQPANYKKIN